MKIRFTFLIITLILISWKSHSKDNDFIVPEKISTYNNAVKNDSLKTIFTSDITFFLKAFNDGDLDLFCNMVYPKLFELQSKEQMIKLIKRVQNNGLNIKTEFKNIGEISKLISSEKEMFCRVQYYINMTVKLSGRMLAGKEKLKQDFQDYYGLKNVKYDNESSTFLIIAKKSMFAVSKKDSSLWKYLEFDENNKTTLYKLIPTNVLEQIGK
jgi:hypothetical protein